MAVQATDDAEDFSSSETIIAFDPPIRLLRGPLPAGLSDDPSIGPFVLAFKDVESWRSALRACEAKIFEQCEGGARIGCSISASSKCKPPWWRTIFRGSTIDLSEREQCEEREMSVCLAFSKESCIKFSKDKCLKPFREARIALIDPKEISKFILKVSQKSAAESIGSKSTGTQQLSPTLLYKCNMEVTNFRGSTLLDSEDSPSESSCTEAAKKF